MGKCYRCGSEVTLREEETRCDNCREILRYWCWNCKKGFDIENKETKEKLKVCSICGYFYCPECSVCGPSCESKIWLERLKEITDGCWTTEILKEVIEFIKEIKLGKKHKNCPYGVPISYAKDKIKYSAARTQGYRSKNQYDTEKFLQRLKQIESMDIGAEFTIDSIREEGVYGQEYRDAANYGVCLGKLKVIYKKNKQDKEYTLFKREDNKNCQYILLKDLVFDWCQSCKTKGICQEVYSKGKNKGQSHTTIKKITNEDICQLPRGLFKKHE
jgi:hypothetical protein